MLEVGSYEGGSLYHWLRLAQPGAVVVSVDERRALDPVIVGPELLNGDVTLHPIVGDSTTALVVHAANAYGPFDWVFIDGGHDYATVCSDWLNYGAPVEITGGLVAFHDVAPHDDKTVGVPMFWEDLKVDEALHGNETVEFVADPPAGWGGIGVVFL